MGMPEGEVNATGAAKSGAADINYSEDNPRPLRRLTRSTTSEMCRYCCKSRMSHRSEFFGETSNREAIDDLDNLSRATEVAYEFSVRR